ncbi:MAG: PilZ domain-containing protein [Candidatus Omnitrophica bacterium]|nr:PilZ domain-containing protein [Candidatus Omnitrophota bacterium]
MDEKRIAPRISWNFVVKYRLRRDEFPGPWEVSVIQNISKCGCCFFGSVQFELGAVLDVEIKLPSMKEPMTFVGEVKRCDSNKDRNMNSFRIGVKFLEMDETKKDNFFSTVDFFLKKQS